MYWLICSLRLSLVISQRNKFAAITCIGSEVRRCGVASQSITPLRLIAQCKPSQSYAPMKTNKLGLCGIYRASTRGFQPKIIKCTTQSILINIQPCLRFRIILFKKKLPLFFSKNMVNLLENYVLKFIVLIRKISPLYI